MKVGRRRTVVAHEQVSEGEPPRAILDRPELQRLGGGGIELPARGEIGDA